MIRELLGIFVLPEENEEELSGFERGVRTTIDRVYRFVLASFFAYHTFQFMFSPIWMHGYVWSLNLPIDLDMADKSAGLIVDHQLKQVCYLERRVHALLLTISLMIMLWRCGFASCSQRVTTLLSLGFVSSIIVAFVRATQMKQRLFSALHEACYMFVMIFVVGLCLCIRLPSDSIHRFPVEAKIEKSEKEEETKKND
ncbi:hypothetical protein PFISCL1PPCAC_6859 [Pristionchus fissidentatus]|uniref:G protein-coupled receptor n=1 Tax=Pristionchus fissidentatus TaxID=1538716 RepID=A0AAV5V7E9_9BILA|nr:hypothetical protein PFISCL1PPCAC_6859 [Pristionchus fissidentatus]